MSFPVLTYTAELQDALQIAKSLAKEHNQSYFAGGHLLKAILHDDVGLSSQLLMWDIDVGYLREWAEIRMSQFPKSGSLAGDPKPAPGSEQALEVADMVRLKLGADSIEPLMVLIALARPEVGFTEEELKTFPITETQLLGLAANDPDAFHNKVTTTGDGIAAPSASGGKNLAKYCVDKTQKARDGRIDPIIGRDEEIRKMAEILSRRSKPNVIIIGEPGVGKTALVDGFARNIAEESVPGHLVESTLLELDTGALVAGASYKGEIEDRLKKIIKEVKEVGKVILFIDEIHVLLDPQGPFGGGAANLLKPELARGEITVVGATTIEEYNKYIEKEEAFKRRFEKLLVEEPSIESAYRMLMKIAPYYEEHHSLPINKKALEECVRLGKRYIKDRRLPDIAIDLMDKTMAAIRLMNDTSLTELERMKTAFQELIDNKESPAEERLPDYKWFFRELEARLSPILFEMAQANEEDWQASDDTSKWEKGIQALMGSLSNLAETKKETVGPGEVAAIVAYSTGIPLGKIQSDERQRLLNMEEKIKERVVGQDYAVSAVADAVIESRAEVGKAGLPIGSFFFLGPTGTGKTELAKSLAEFLFDDESSLIRFDMSEFKEEHSAATLLGAPAGYVGYEEGGLLVNKIRHQPFAVVLFDEIEKAHPSVFDIFLQILDEGRLTDRLGKPGDFSNAIILFTSNIGSEWIVEQFGKGEVPEQNTLLDIMGRHFRPEFLGRLTQIAPFAPITEDAAIRIFDIQLKQLVQSLENQEITLKISKEAKKLLATEGFNPKYGARPLRGVIRSRLRKPISRKIVAGELKPGMTLTIEAKDNDITWEESPSA